MKEKKHIDQLFKESFKNFEASPSPQVWDNILTKLKKEKEDRKVIPIWIKLGGVAALLALVLTIGNFVFSPFDNNNTTPSITEEKTEINTQNSEDNIIFKENKTKKVEVVSEDTNTDNTLEDSSNKNDIRNESIISESEVAYENDTKSLSDKNKKHSDNIIKNSESKTSKVTDAVAKNDVNNKTSDLPPNKEEADYESIINKEKVIPVANDKEAVAIDETVDNKNIGSETDKTETEVAASEEENKRSIFDAIDETNKEDVVVVVNNKPDNRWEIASNVGPVYYNSLSEGSSIDPSFSDNSKSGDLNITYGVQVSYHLNNRLSVRSGLSNVNLSYTTTGIELGNGPVSVALKSVDYTKSDNVVITVDKGTLTNINPDGEFGNVTPKSTSGEPSLHQKISYYEVPLELKYALLNKKIGVNLIGGFSTLFIGNNEVSVEAGDFNETLGEANNLSSLSFTTNIGLGLKYSFSKKLMFNIEPMFKYQLNPYTDSSVDFKPYYVGIYSGLSFKF